ncbi:MAG: metal ABC transporter substrate-binding protein [Fimbriimonadaceae bacterium]|nr:metal ABC transporter substrate-binding protein [Fimbriimonadaceae bacterium]
MKHLLFLSAILLAAAAPAQSPLKVVTTTQDLASIAASVGGNLASVSSLIVGARDPHHIEAKPSYMSRVAGADLFIAVGLELEVGYEQSILSGSRNGRVQIGQLGHLYASDDVPLVGKPTGPVTRAEGDIHPYGNPHYWLDPYNARIIADHIAARMGALRPAGAKTFDANAEAFKRSVDVAMFGAQLVSKFGGDKLWQWEVGGQLASQLAANGAANLVGGWEKKMAPLNGKAIITYHRSWSYFVNRFGIKIVGELEPKPGLDPTPGHVASLLKIASANGVKVILQEPFYHDTEAKFVASRTGAKVVVAPGSVGQDPAARDYVSLINTIVDRLASVYGG